MTSIDLLVAFLSSLLPATWKTLCSLSDPRSWRGTQHTLGAAESLRAGGQAGGLSEGTAAKHAKLRVESTRTLFLHISVLSLALHWGSPNPARCCWGAGAALQLPDP